MDLKTYILQIGRAKAAALFGVSYPAVCHWVSGFRRPSPDRALSIERATNGVVTRHELRPDLYPD